MAEKGDSMDTTQKEQTQKLRDELKTALDNNDIETLKTKMNELEQAAAYMQQAQAAQGGANAGAGAQANPGSSADDVVDADFTSKDNGKA